MSHASIPPTYWDHIFQSVVFLINRLPPTSHSHTPPYTTLFQRQPDYTFLRVLGCLCFPYLRPYNDHKLQFQSLPCVFLGYYQTQKGYKCLHIPTNRFYISRHVRFDESQFPFAGSPAPVSSLDWLLPLPNSLFHVPQPTHLPTPQPTHLSIQEPASTSSSLLRVDTHSQPIILLRPSNEAAARPRYDAPVRPSSEGTVRSSNEEAAIPTGPPSLSPDLVRLTPGALHTPIISA